MNFLTSLPAIDLATLGSARAVSRARASSASAGSSICPTRLPLTWTPIVTVSSTQSAGSNAGHGSYASVAGWPRACQASSARCGARGERSSTSASYGSRGSSSPRDCRWLEKTIICEIAVLKESASTSALTFWIVLCISRSVSTPISAPSATLDARVCTRFWKRTTPEICSVCHGLTASSGPMNISYSRIASAPYVWTMSSGLTTLPRDLDIFSPSSPRIIPWCTSFLNGSAHSTRPRSYSTLCQKRAYSRWSTACSAPPTYRSTGSQSDAALGDHAAAALAGSAKRM
mmetsp:Transcript_29056/g.49658  ORF Transcript_29056/g.49658 Transcript_29056/m.49658 type:complete len:288 (-) Transcript_29056:531-1394(-)